jgi:hypothetical protein
MIKSVGAILVGQRVILPVVSLLALFIECQFRPQGKSKIPPTNNYPVVPGAKSVRRKSCTKPSNRLRMYFILPQTVLQQTPIDVQQGPRLPGHWSDKGCRKNRTTSFRWTCI